MILAHEAVVRVSKTQLDVTENLNDRIQMFPLYHYTTK